MLSDTQRLDAMFSSRSWRQPLIKFGNREEVDAAIERGNPDGPPIPAGYACRSTICHIIGKHTEGCKGLRDSMKHAMQYNCIRPDCGGTCFGCTLGRCSRCGQSEGGLATECPGVTITSEQADDIYAGKIDFIGGVWKVLDIRP